MKKICYITTIPGTIRAFILKFAEYLHSTGEFDISFICNPDDQFAASLPEYFHYYPVKMKRGVGLDGPRAIAQMVKIFRREKFDLVQYSTPNAACYASIAARIARVPVRLYGQWGLIYVAATGIKRFIFKTMEKMICYNSTWVEPISAKNLEFAIKEKLFPAHKGSIVWNGGVCGVSVEKFDVNKKAEYRTAIRDKYNIQTDEFVFGFMGRINKAKGVNELLSAMKKLVLDYPKAYLMIVGKSEASRGVDEELFQWAHDCPRVILTGYTQVPEQYMAAMDCFVLPSYREGFGTVVAEAEAMEIPVIVTNIPGPTDAMLENETGLVVERQDVEKLLLAMKMMIESPELCVEFGKNGREYVVSHFEQKYLFMQTYEDLKRLLK